MEKNSVLVRLRAERGMTQKELAEELHVTRQAVSQWESGTTMPSMEKLLELSRVFEVPVDELYGSGPAKEMQDPVPSLQESKGSHRKKIIPLSILAAYICFVAGILLWGNLTHSLFWATHYIIWGTIILVLGCLIKFGHQFITT